ncbi:MAG TPA: hypothetical protein VLJ20_00505 [Acetobacteraceae bacterium]|nr:hypothetical protein [Acetobacteraceae bacterium]
MAIAPATGRTDPYVATGGAQESAVSAISWAAIIAGAFAAAAISLLLFALGAGVGFASASPWSGAGASAATFTVAAAVWLIVIQWLSSALGGYLTGRLRTKWVGVHTHEVFFRDTAHGFLTWAVASVVVAAFLASSVSSVVSGGAHIAGNAVSGATQGATQGAASSPSSSTGYFVDSLFRSDQPNTSASPQETRGEATRILAKSAANGTVDPADRTYLAKLVAARTGLSQADAEKRVDDVMAQEQAAEAKVRAAADAARKRAASLSFFTFLSMLIGAFIAAVAGAIGGRERDEY